MEARRMMEAAMAGAMEGSSRMDITDISRSEMGEAAMGTATATVEVVVAAGKVDGTTTGRVGRMRDGRAVPTVTTAGGTRMIMETTRRQTGTRVWAMWRST